jgi:hypothetical protein
MANSSPTYLSLSPMVVSEHISFPISTLNVTTLIKTIPKLSELMLDNKKQQISCNNGCEVTYNTFSF